MQFAALPPEINSGLMYTGPGSGPMLAAAAAWDGLSGELRSTATAYESTVSGLTSGAWLGPSSAVMAAAAAPYAVWLAATAGLVEQTAAQARAAVAAYEAAFAMTVAPPVIAANRAELAVLVATNLFGQNTAAIAANEAHYAQMWAQDAAAMHTYAGSAAIATQLTPFTRPPQTTSGNPAGQSALAQAAAATSSAVQAITAPAQGSLVPPFPQLLINLLQIESAFAPGLTASSLAVGSSSWNAAATNSRLLLRNTNEILDNHQVLLDSEDEILRVESEILGALNGRTPAGGLPTSAGLARAVSVGKLSVPLNWAVAAPEIRTVAYTLPTVGAGVAALAETPAAAFGQMALAGMGGSALAGSVSRGRGEYVGAKSGERVQVIADEPAETPPQDSPMTEIVTGIRQLSELRDSGLLTAKEFDDQKQRLLELPLRSALPQ